MILKAEKRETTGRKVRDLRASGKVPAEVYGHGFENITLTLSAIEFDKVLAEAGESTLVDLKVGSDEPVKVIIQDIQRDPIKDYVTHVDLRQVRMDEKIEAEVMINFEGTPTAVKELGGILVTPLDSIHIKALPQNLVLEIKVDITVLNQIGSVLRVSDLNIPDTLEVLNDPNAAVALIDAPRKAEDAEDSATPEEKEKAAVQAAAGEPKEEAAGDEKKEKKD